MIREKSLLINFGDLSDTPALTLQIITHAGGVSPVIGLPLVKHSKVRLEPLC